MVKITTAQQQKMHDKVHHVPISQAYSDTIRGKQKTELDTNVPFGFGEAAVKMPLSPSEAVI